jgi:undecaprenyl-diphosphatase
VPLIVFVGLADEVRDRDTLQFDEAVLRFVNQASTPALDRVVIAITNLGDKLAVVVFALVAGVMLYRSRRRRAAVVVLLGVAGAAALNLIIKSLFQRDRPELWERLVTETSYSFPSGHSMASSALALSLIIVMWNTKYRLPVVCILGVYAILVGLSRLYLGVHYPTDVLAGWLVSATWVGLVAQVVLTAKRPSGKKSN